MVSPGVRGIRRTAHAQGVRYERLSTNDVLGLLGREGFFVTRRMIDHAVALGLVPAPQKTGGWRRWSSDHIAAIRAYLLTRSRKQASELDGGRG